MSLKNAKGTREAFHSLIAEAEWAGPLGYYDGAASGSCPWCGISVYEDWPDSRIVRALHRKNCKAAVAMGWRVER